MANFSITEYSDIALDRTGIPMAVGLEPAINIQSVSFTATPGISSEFNKSTRLVRVIADADCRIKFGTSPTAGSGSTLLNAEVAEYFGVGAQLKVSVIEA